MSNPFVRDEVADALELVLRLQKERINRGEVRVRKEIITELQTVQVPVTREELGSSASR